MMMMMIFVIFLNIIISNLFYEYVSRWNICYIFNEENNIKDLDNCICKSYLSKIEYI
jgi:hypothetical protein